MSMLLIVIIILLVFLGLPQVGGHWHNWGYGPSGIGFVLLIILIVLVLSGRL